jgi:hypothetical protein
MLDYFVHLFDRQQFPMMIFMPGLSAGLAPRLS